MNKIKSFYIIKDIILFYIPLKRVLQLFKVNRRCRQLLGLYPSIYELYNNIQNDFEPYNEYIENEMLSYIVHFSRLQKHLSDKLLIEYYFRFLLTQKKILVEYDNIYFGPLLKYLNDKKYNGTLIIKLGEPKLDLSIRPNIEITGKNILLEFYFNMKWIDREKKDNIEYIKQFLEEKIIGEETKNIVKKIQFGEYINLNEEKYEDFFFEELSKFPNALFNIQSNYFDDNMYWKDLDRFFRLKFIIEDKLDIDKDTNKKENKSEKKVNKEKDINNNIDNNNNNNNNQVNKNENKNENTKIKSISKYYKEKKLSKNLEKEKNNNEKIEININNINKNEIKNEEIKYLENNKKETNNNSIKEDLIININNNDNKINPNIDNKIITNNDNKINTNNDNKIITNNDNKIITNNDNKIIINNDNLYNNNNIINLEDDKNKNNINGIYIINKDESEFQNEELLIKIKRLNKNILSIRDLNDFILDFRKNEINVTEEFFKVYEKKSEYIENKLPPKLTLINFTYEKYKEYFSELNNKISSLIIVQRIYRNTPYPFFLSSELKSLIALKLERINILEDNLVCVINNNPLLEIFEIHKNYTGYIFGYSLALALSNLKYLKSLTTEFFWYKDNIPNFKDNDLVNKQENEFFKFLISKSLKYLSLANETNININTLQNNLPNLISLTMEYSNIIEESKNNENIGPLNNIISKPNDNDFPKRKRFSSMKNIKKASLNTPIFQMNYLKDFKYSEKDRPFKKLRDLNLVRIQNCDEFFKKMAFFNKIENLYIDYYDKPFFETFVKYGYFFNNLDMLFISPDFTERIKPLDSENLVKIIHYFKKLTFLEIGFYTINEELVNLLFNELTKLPLLQQLEIRVDISSDENKEILQNKIDQLKTKKCNSKFLTISYHFNDKRYKKAV